MGGQNLLGASPHGISAIPSSSPAISKLPHKVTTLIRSDRYQLPDRIHFSSSEQWRSALADKGCERDADGPKILAISREVRLAIERRPTQARYALRHYTSVPVYS